MTRQLNNDNGLQARWTETPAPNRVDGSADCSTEYASHTTVRTVLVYGGSQIDGFSEM
jgi:hypothetical protein